MARDKAGQKEENPPIETTQIWHVWNLKQTYFDVLQFIKLTYLLKKSLLTRYSFNGKSTMLCLNLASI